MDNDLDGSTPQSARIWNYWRPDTTGVGETREVYLFGGVGRIG